MREGSRRWSLTRTSGEERLLGSRARSETLTVKATACPSECKRRASQSEEDKV